MINKNTPEYWNKKHGEQYKLYEQYDFDQIPMSPLSYHKIASDIIGNNLDAVKNKSILEIGCAAGYFCSYLHHKILPFDWTVEGWDFSKSGIDIASDRNKNETNMTFKNVDILSNPVNNDYGFICSFETIEHIEENKNYKLLDQWLDHCEYLILSTVDTVDSCNGEHISHYNFTSFEDMGYTVMWKEKLAKIDMSPLNDFGDYHYIIFLLRGKLKCNQ